MDKGQALAVRLLKRGHDFKWFVFCWSLKPVLYNSAPAQTCNMYLLVHMVRRKIYFLVFFPLPSLFPSKRKTFVTPWVLLPTGVHLHHDVPNALSEDTGHCHSSKLWWGKLLAKLYTSHNISNLLLFPLTLIVSLFMVLPGPEFFAALLAGDAAPHAACPRLPNRGEHRRCVWLHPLQGHLWGTDAHRPASTAW